MHSYKWFLRSFLLTTVVLALVLTYSTHTNSYAQDSNSAQIIRVNTDKFPEIEIVVSILDTSGRPLPGLTSKDFSAFEDDKGLTLKSVTSITEENIPLSIVLVIDTSRSMVGFPLDSAKLAASNFIDQVRDIDELSLITFNSTAIEVQAPTKDKTALKDKVKNLKATGQTALYDAIAQAVKTAQTGTAQRRAIVLLTDGAEYGNLSKTGRNEAYQLADKAGIPIFAIGLGFGVDEPYLSAVAKNTGGAYYRSPKPEDLAKVYTGIGTLLRSLYVLTFDTSSPADGSTHQIRVEAKGGSAQFSARYPAPIPVIKFGDFDSTTPMQKPTTVTPQIAADNKITGYDYQIDGKSVAKADGDVKPLTIDPMTLTPGKHNLKLAVTDDKGHIGEGAVDFQVAGLPPEFTIDGLKNGETLNTNRAVTLTVGASQTPVSTAAFDIDGVVISTLQQAPYTAAIDVLSLAPGNHKLTVQLKNTDATGTRTVDFVIPPGPRQSATANALRQATIHAQETLAAMPTNTPVPTHTATSKSTFTPIPSTNTVVPTSTSTQLSTKIPPTVTSTPVSSTNTPPPSDTPLPKASNTPIVAVVVSTDTPFPSSTPLPSATNSPVPPTVTSTPVPPSNTPLPTNTATVPPPTATNTALPTNTATPPPSFTPSPTSTATVTPSATPIPTLNTIVNFASSPLGVVCGGIILLLLIVLTILLGGRGNRRRTQ
ncbi:MAG: VWA domain-containing protein [Chloroflexota bacterium]